MQRALLALSLSLALSGSPLLQWAVALVEVAASAVQADAGNQFDPDGVHTNAGNSFDPDGVHTNVGNQWDPNG
jgi:hypothetical protein